MVFMTWIVDRLTAAQDTFSELYLDVYFAGWPLNIMADWFYDLVLIFNDLAWRFSQFGEWVNTVQAQLGDGLGWSTIWSTLLSYVPNLEEIRDWFYYWPTYVTDLVNAWWSSTGSTVAAWIDESKAWTWSLVQDLQGRVGILEAGIVELRGSTGDIAALVQWFTDWRGQVLGEISGWWSGALLDVQALIDTAFTTREPFWAGWSDWRDKVVEFFTDPEDQVLKILERGLERFW